MSLPSSIHIVEPAFDFTGQGTTVFFNYEDAHAYALNDGEGARIWSVSVPADTVVHKVEKVPATYRLVQVEP